jgi:hypothetical protein
LDVIEGYAIAEVSQFVGNVLTLMLGHVRDHEELLLLRRRLLVRNN